MCDLTGNFFERDEVLIDLSHRCPLGCPRCQRQENYADLGIPVVGHDLPLSSLEKLTNKFKNISFGGQLSDPIHHPKFIEILKMCNNKQINTKVQTASSFKPESWYPKAFEANIDAKWQFGIDGLPEQSHKYRVNQDGVKLFNIMCRAKNYLKNKPIWQCIVFRYNEDSLDAIRNLAKENNLELIIMYSSRWLKKRDDPLRPINPEMSIG
tara:strand:- start:1530 stop:2159 length:630 start_codon:yes stop_codon:yes gene_type:complete